MKCIRVTYTRVIFLFILCSTQAYGQNVVLNEISCSHPSGFYNDKILLSLTPANESHKIYYTLNGEVPTTKSFLYSSPLHITSNPPSRNDISSIPSTPLEGPDQLYDFIWKEPKDVYKANTVRFASFQGDIMQSQIFTKTYFIDPDIENHYSFPILSLVTDSLNLFDYNTGIYIPGRTFDEFGYNWFPSGNYHNRGSEWERNIHVSYFENDGTIAFETDAGMRMRGYGSAANPQKSFGVYFRKEYGQNKIEYPVFDNSNTDIHKRLIFRNSGNDFLHTHFKDALLQDLLMSLDIELQDFHPSVVFFNGEYWGIYGIRQKYDKYYFKYQFGIDENNINILGVCGDVEEGTNKDYLELIDFIQENDMSLNENYLFAQDKVDIQNFIDFQIAEIYYANYDWPCNNFKIWKTNDPNSKWRFLISDLDLSFAFDSNSSFDTPSLEHATSEDSEWPHCKCSNILLRKFLENEEFVQQFVDRFAYHLNTTFNSELVIERINKFETLFAPEMSEHIARWRYPSSLRRWHKNVEVLREFARKRPCFISTDIITFFNLSEFDFECYSVIDEFEEERIFALAPNPSNGVFFLNNQSSDTIEFNVRITSITGQVIHVENDIIIDGFGRYYFDLSELPNNTYILNCFSSNLSEWLKMIIIH